MNQVKEIKLSITNISPIDEVYKPIYQEGGKINKVASFLKLDNNLILNHFASWNKWIGWYKLYKLIKVSIKSVNADGYVTFCFKVKKNDNM